MKLLLIPGAGCGKRAWICQTLYFSGSEAIALPGHPEGKPSASIDGYVEWLRSYIQRQRYQDVILAGHSMGGAVAQLYGLRYGAEVRALILVSTGAKLRIRPSLLKSVEGMITDQTGWAEYLKERHRTTVPEIRQMVIEERLWIGPSVMLNDLLCCDKFDILDRVHDIKLPTLIISGSDDELTPVRYAHYLRDEIRGAREVIVPGAGHWVQAEKPDEVNRAMESFLAGLK